MEANCEIVLMIMLKQKVELVQRGQRGSGLESTTFILLHDHSFTFLKASIFFLLFFLYFVLIGTWHCYMGLQFLKGLLLQIASRLFQPTLAFLLPQWSPQMDCFICLQIYVDFRNVRPTCRRVKISKR